MESESYRESQDPRGAEPSGCVGVLGGLAVILACIIGMSTGALGPTENPVGCAPPSGCGGVIVLAAILALTLTACSI